MITLPSHRKIGPGEPVFIIAEVGSNWTSLDDCLLSIRAAKACGADAVKFQLYNWHSLYGFGVSHTYTGDEDGGVWPVDKLQGVLEIEWLPRLKAECDKVGLEFMCSAFSVGLLNAVDPFVNIHKMASAEMTHLRMLERLREIGKPVFLSTGAQSMTDIGYSKRVLGNTPHILLYCPAAYPARYTNLGMIYQLGRGTGFSDHTLDVSNAPVLACLEYGATVLEKHVRFVDANGPDSAHSLNQEEFRLMVGLIRDWVPFSYPTPEEQPFITRHKRRLIATRDIAVGDTLREGDNFGIYRSLKDDTHAFSPFAIDQVVGKVALRAIRAGDGVGPGDV